MKRKSPLLIIFITVFLDLVGFGLIIPLLPFYAQSFGASSLAIGSITATYSIAQLIFTPILGALSDRIGRRPVLLATLLVSSAAFVVGGIGGALWVLFLARAINGIASSNLSVAQAFIADVTTAENRAKGMGLIGAAFGLGFVIGPALGGTLGSINHSLPFFVAAGLSLANFGLAYFILPESLPLERRAGAIANRERRPNLIVRLRLALARPELRRPMAIFFCFNLAFTGFEVALPLFTQHRYGYNTQQNGYLFAYIGVIIVLMQGGLIGRIVKRLGERRTLQIGLALVTITLFVLPLGHILALLLVVLFFLSIGEGASTPTSSAIISLAVGSREQGETLGLSQALGSLARILGPLWAGLAFDGLGEAAPFIIAGALMALALALALSLHPNNTNKASARASEAGDKITAHV